MILGACSAIQASGLEGMHGLTAEDVNKCQDLDCLSTIVQEGKPQMLIDFLHGHLQCSEWSQRQREMISWSYGSGTQKFVRLLAQCKLRKDDFRLKLLKRISVFILD